MTDLLQRQVGLYRQIERLSGAQRECIEREDSRPLLCLLSDRQRLTAALTELNGELAPFRLRWDDLKMGLSAAERGEIEALFREVGERLRRILAGDEADARLLAARRDSTAGDLRGLDAARRALNAYGSAPARPAAILEGTEA